MNPLYKLHCCHWNYLGVNSPKWSDPISINSFIDNCSLLSHSPEIWNSEFIIPPSIFRCIHFIILSSALCILFYFCSLFWKHVFIKVTGAGHQMLHPSCLPCSECLLSGCLELLSTQPPPFCSRDKEHTSQPCLLWWAVPRMRRLQFQTWSGRFDYTSPPFCSRAHLHSSLSLL